MVVMSRKSRNRFNVPGYGDDLTIPPELLKHVYDNIDGSGPTSQAIRDALLNDALATASWQRNEVSADNAAVRQVDTTRELRQTQFQDTVSSAQAAGINPYFALGAGVTSPAASPQGSSSAGTTSSGAPRATLDSLLNIIQTAQVFRKQNAEIRNIKAETNVANETARNIATDTALKGSQTRGQDIDNEWKPVLYDAEQNAKNSAAKLDQERVGEVYANIRRAEKEAHLAAEQAKTEESKRDALGAEALLSRANAWQIVELMDYNKALMASQVAKNNAEAEFYVVQKAYQQGLIDAGMIAAMVRSQNAQASEAETSAAVNEATEFLTRQNAGQISNNDTVNAIVGGLYGFIRTAGSVLGGSFSISPVKKAAKIGF